ncbi:MAG: TIR domain-containing protein [Hyphomonadaceae bacterium]
MRHAGRSSSCPCARKANSTLSRAAFQRIALISHRLRQPDLFLSLPGAREWQREIPDANSHGAGILPSLAKAFVQGCEMSLGTRRFRAFISYSQKDAAQTKRLHKSLEAYRVPMGVLGVTELAKRRRLGRFFRDDDDMSAAADIAGIVRGAIEDAESLIVICSPNSAKSKWVNAEIEHYRKTGRSGKVFAVIVDGQPNSGTAKTECFPPALRVAANAETPDAMPIEPLALDVRKQSKARLLARLAAGLLEVDFDQLWKRDRRRALANGVRTALVASLVIAAIGAVSLWGMRTQVTGFSRQLAQTSLSEATAGHPDAALRLAVLAMRGDALLGPAAEEAEPALAKSATMSNALVELSGHTAALQFAAFSPDGRFVASAADDGTTRIWDTTTGAQVSLFKTGEPNDPATLPLNEALVWGVAFNPDGSKILIARDDRSGEDGFPEFIGVVGDTRTGDELFRVPICFVQTTDYSGASTDLRLSVFTDEVIISQGESNCARVFRAADGAELPKDEAQPFLDAAQPEPLWQYAYGPIMNTLAIGDELDSGEIANERLLIGHTAGIAAVDHVRQPTAPWIATASFDGTARLWDDRDGRELERFVGHTDAVVDVAFSPDASRILTASRDGTVRIWQGPEYETTSDSEFMDDQRDTDLAPRLEHTATRELYWPPEDEDGPVDLIDSTTGKVIAHLNGPDGHTGRIFSATFSPDGSRLVTSGADAIARVWDAGSGRQLLRLVGHTDAIRDAVFSPDGTRILTAGDSSSVRLWDAGTGIELAQLADMSDSPNLSYPLAFGDTRFSSDGAQAYFSELGGEFEAVSITTLMGPGDRKRDGLPSLRDFVCDPSTGRLGGSLRLIKRADVALMPSLRGREGEDVCSGAHPAAR